MTAASLAKMADAHDVSISCEPPSRSGALVLGGGHRARCSCGWWSDCYAMLADTQRAVDVHLRRAARVNFEDLLARATVGASRRRSCGGYTPDNPRVTRRRRDR